MLKVTGLEELSRKMRDIAERAKGLDGQHTVPLPELMPAGFISSCSSYATVDDLFEASPFKIDSPEDFKAIPDAGWDEFIAGHTSFASWHEMQEAAVKAWTAKRLGL